MLDFIEPVKPGHAYYEYATCVNVDTDEREQGWIKYSTEWLVADCETTRNFTNAEIISQNIPPENVRSATIAFGLGNPKRGWNWVREPEKWMEMFDEIGDNHIGMVIVYFHNLDFDFRMNLDYFRDRVVAYHLLNGRICRIWLDSGIELRCSYMLSQTSLESFIAEYSPESINPKTHGWDYDLIRNRKTPLTQSELEYVRNDLAGLYDAILGISAHFGCSVRRLPMTKTGFVRRIMRKTMKTKEYGKGRDHKWRETERQQLVDCVKEMTLTEELENALYSAYSGGISTVNSDKSRKMFDDVASWDINSSYPHVMVTEKYPMGEPQHYDHIRGIDIDSLFVGVACLENIRLKDGLGISPIMTFPHSDHPIINPEWSEHNRLISSEYLEMPVTSLQMEIIQRFYTFTFNGYKNVYVWPKSSYLPNPIRRLVIENFRDKTLLKGDDPDKYMMAKVVVNSIYGIMGTRPIRPDQRLDLNTGGVTNIPPDVEQCLSDANSGRNPWKYVWAVFVTAYAQRNLCAGIYRAGNDILQVDTDSVKMIGKQRASTIFNTANSLNNITLRGIEIQLGLPESYLSPTHPKTGEPVPLGAWESEGDEISQFMPVKSKMYVYKEYSDEVKAVAAGIPKADIKRQLARNEELGIDCWESFRDGFAVDLDISTKLTHYTRTEQPDTVYEDQYGKSQIISQHSCLLLLPTTYCEKYFEQNFPISHAVRVAFSRFNYGRSKSVPSPEWMVIEHVCESLGIPRSTSRRLIRESPKSLLKLALAVARLAEADAAALKSALARLKDAKV